MTEQSALPGMEAGRRAERTEFGLRTAKDNIFRRKGHVEPMSSPERAVECRDRPFSGRSGDEQVVTRMIVTYTTGWTVVPGHEGSRHLSCHHPDTPQGRPSGNMLAQGPDYQMPHAFRERDMAAGDDGVLRYTCPVCGLVWQLRNDGPDKPAGNMPADIPPDETLMTLFLGKSGVPPRVTATIAQYAVGPFSPEAITRVRGLHEALTAPRPGDAADPGLRPGFSAVPSGLAAPSLLRRSSPPGRAARIGRAARADGRSAMVHVPVKPGERVLRR